MGFDYPTGSAPGSNKLVANPPGDGASQRRASGLLTYVQLCDAVAKIPATDEELLTEARGHRLNPGTGTLWLEELFDILPHDIAISFEVPGAGAPAVATLDERIRLAASAMDSWLARYRARASRTSSC